MIAGNASAEIARIREKMRRSVNKRVRTLETIADGTARVTRPFGKDADMIECAPDFGERIRAVETMLRYGVGPPEQSVDVTSAGQALVIRVVRE